VSDAQPSRRLLTCIGHGTLGIDYKKFWFK
jgi:hypothetical protein